LSRAREHERGDVRAGDQQQHGYRTEEEPQRAADIADDRGLESIDTHTNPAVRIRKLRGEPRLNEVEVGSCLLERNARFQASDSRPENLVTPDCPRRVDPGGRPGADVAIVKLE